MSSNRERNHYNLKEIENTKIAKIVSVAWHHKCFDWNVYYYRKMNSFIGKTQIFD